MPPSPYQCLACGHSPLDQGADVYRCARCCREYPVRFGVPLFLRDLRFTPSGFEVSADLAARLCQLHHCELTEARRAALAGIFSWDYHLPDLGLTAENNSYFHRILSAEAPRRPTLPEQAAGLPINDAVRYQVVGHSLLAALPPGRVLTRNIRLHNTGPSVISSKGERAVRLGYRWRHPGGAEVPGPSEWTPLPIELLPGRSLTLPLLLRTPGATGAYLLEVRLHQQGRGWLDDGGCAVAVEVLRGAADLPAHWTILPAPPEGLDYAADHARGRQRAAVEVERRGGRRLRLLEVGSCCAPQARGLADEVYSVDIDVQTLQVGEALSGQPGLHFVAADVHNLPFAPASFDGVLVFAALHHFADPVGVLARLKRLLAPGGFLAVMCEPSGHYAHGEIDAGLRRELEQGINEQLFTLEELHSFILHAGLCAEWVEVEGGSFKAILTAGAALSEPPAAPARPPLSWRRIVRGVRRRIGALWRAA